MLNEGARYHCTSENFANTYKPPVYSGLSKVREHDGMIFTYAGVIFNKLKNFLLRFALYNFQFSKRKYFKNEVLPQIEHTPQIF